MRSGLTVRERMGQALRSVAWRCRTVLAGRRRDRETAEEMQFHLEMATAERVRRGMDPAAARREALLELGSREALGEACREERGLPWLETTLADLRYGIRSLGRSPAYTVAAAGILALGVGAVAAVAPVVEAVLVRPLPYPQSERLVALWESRPDWGWERSNASPANLLDWREQVSELAAASAHSWVHGWALGGAGGPERVSGVQVFDGFFTVFGEPMTLGRDLRSEELWSSGEPVVVLGHELWRHRFGADEAILGRTIELDGNPHTVVGVAPRGFAYPEPGLGAFVPYRFDPESRSAVWFRRSHFIRPVGRLAPGVDVAAAQARMAAVAAELAERYPETNEGLGAGMTPLREWVVGDVRRPLWVVAGAVALLLLVACANVAGLALGRSGARGRELAVRASLGAGRRRLARQLVTDNALLAAVGGLSGAVLGTLGLRLLLALAGDALPRAHEVQVHLGALLAACAVTAGTMLLFGVAPALRAAGVPPADALRSEGRGHTLGRRDGAWGRRWLVAAEVALAMVLVGAAALAVRSFTALTAVDPGFAAEGRVAITYHLPAARYPEAERATAFHRRALAEAQALPGVTSAALASSLGLESSRWTSVVLIEGEPPRESTPEFNRRIVSPGYFRTLGVPVLAGEPLPDGAGEATAAVVVVNETLARRFFPGRDAVGQRVDWDAGGERVWRTIVGVVGDERVEGLSSPAPAEILLPTGQELLDGTGWFERTYTLVLHVATDDPEAVLPLVRDRFAQLDPELPLYDARSLAGMLAESTRRERLVTALLAFFAGTALALAVVGLYGLVAGLVSERRREIGIRLALGATPASVARALVGRVAALVGLGLGVGLAGAAGGARVLRGVLYGVEGAVPATLAGAAGLLLLAAVLAAAWPARRAARLDPMETLRAD